MDNRKNQEYTPEFKTEVVLEALKETLTCEQIAEKFGCSPSQVSEWKEFVLENASEIFEDDFEEKEERGDGEAQIEKMQKELKQMEVELEWMRGIYAKLSEKGEI